MTIHMPVYSPKITSPYGERIDPITKQGTQFHDGIDLISKHGDTSVFAITNGIVTHDMDDYDHIKRLVSPHTAGNYIIIKHAIADKYYYVRYLHLGENYFQKGDKVTALNKIGFYGDYGRSAGAHLHIDFYTEKWKKIDPTPILFPKKHQGAIRPI